MRDIEHLQGETFSQVMPDDVLLILVHPGRACRAAESKIGQPAARNHRQFLLTSLDRHHGPVLIIKGENANELKDYAQFSRGVQEIQRYAKTINRTSAEFFVDTPDLEHAGQELAAKLGERMSSLEIHIAGAFVKYLGANRVNGQVGAVYNGIKSVYPQANVSILDSSVDEDYMIPPYPQF